MKIPILLLALFSLSFVSQCEADVLIHKYVIRNQYIGTGEEFIVTVFGYTVFDPDTGEKWNISYRILPNAKSYRIRTNSIYQAQVQGRGRTFTVLARASSEFTYTNTVEFNSVYLRGRNVPLPISTTRTISYPVLFTGRGSEVWSVADGQRTGEGTFTVVFLKGETRRSNAAGETVSAAIARLSAALEAKGYVLEP
jgi:hypothetical protein